MATVDEYRALLLQQPEQPSANDVPGLITRIAQEQRVPPELALSLARMESGLNPRAEGPPTKYGRAQGLFQIMPSFARDYGVTDGFNPEDNARGALSTLRRNYERFGSWDRALAAHHAGAGAVERSGGIPNTADVNLKTAEYVRRILAGAGDEIVEAGAPQSTAVDRSGEYIYGSRVKAEEPYGFRPVEAAKRGLAGMKLGLDVAASGLERIVTGSDETTGPILEKARLEFDKMNADPRLAQWADRIDKAEGLMPALYEGVAFAVTNPTMVGNFLAEQAPAMVAGLPFGAVAGSAVARTLAGAGVAKRYAQMAGTSAFGATLNSSQVVMQGLGTNYSEARNKGMAEDDAVRYATDKTIGEVGPNAMAGALMAWMPVASRFERAALAKGMAPDDIHVPFLARLKDAAIQSQIQGLGGAAGAYTAATAVGEDPRRSDMVLEYLGEAALAPVEVVAEAFSRPRTAKDASSLEEAAALPITPVITPEQVRSSTVSSTIPVTPKAQAALAFDEDALDQVLTSMRVEAQQDLTGVRRGPQDGPDGQQYTRDKEGRLRRPFESGGVAYDYETTDPTNPKWLYFTPKTVTPTIDSLPIDTATMRTGEQAAQRAEAAQGEYVDRTTAMEDAFAARTPAQAPATTVEAPSTPTGVTPNPAAYNDRAAAMQAEIERIRGSRQAIDTAAAEAATSPTNERPEPTKAQQDAGNYKKGHIRVSGLDISVENPAGSERRGIDRSGKPWSTTMSSHYGYIKGTVGKDKDHLDVFVKPGTDPAFAGAVFVVDQVEPTTGRFDEHKILLGFDSVDEAQAAYKAHYDKDWTGGRAISSASMDEVKAWLASGNTTKPFAGIAQVSQEVAATPDEAPATTVADPATNEAEPSTATTDAPPSTERGQDGNVSDRAKTSEPDKTDKADKPKRKTKAERASDEQFAKVKEHFAPGNIIFSSYWRHYDKVLAFKGEKLGDWQVQVQRVVADGDGWKASGDPRWHSTRPEATDQIAARAKPDSGTTVPDSGTPIDPPAPQADTTVSEDSNDDPGNTRRPETDGEPRPAAEGAEPAQAVKRKRPTGRRSGGTGATDGSDVRDAGTGSGRAGDAPGSVDGATQPAQPSTERGERDGDRAGDGVPGRPGTDHRLRDGLERQGSWRETAKRNLDIIELSKAIEAEGRTATADEQALMAQYTGFGASEVRQNLFPTKHNFQKARKELFLPENARDEKWRALSERARDLLTEQEQREVLSSTQYAHYTWDGIVRGIYDGLARLGFTGGKLLEPGMGNGRFAMLMPDAMYAKTRYTGIERDTVTARIAKLLLPQQNVIAGDFVKTKLPLNYFDAAAGNPPFANTTILSDPVYKKFKFLLHDYFFAKTIDSVRPGGLLAFVTSNGTMDKGSDKARAYLAERADLLGAIRLPNTAFKQDAGTEVVTDVLFFRKREIGEAPGGEAFTNLAEVKIGDKTELINEYYVAHPEMVLGQHATTGTMYAADSYTVEPNAGEDLAAAFARAVERLPENVYTKAKASQATKAPISFERDFNPKTKKEGGLYKNEAGELKVLASGSGVPLEVALGRKPKPAELALLTDYLTLRDTLKDAQIAQWNDADWEGALKTLQREYKAFVKRHGEIQAFTTTTRKITLPDGTEQEASYKRFKNWNLLRRADVEYSLVWSLEEIKNDTEIVHGDMLKGRTIAKPAAVEVKGAPDALAVSLNATGLFDIADVAARLNQTVAETFKQLDTLVYETPDGEVELADEYLSGDVVSKLEAAEIAAAADGKYKRNVDALRAVQPKALGAADITVRLGATWITPEVVSQFASEVLEVEAKVQYNPLTNQWDVEGGNRRTGAGVDAEWSAPQNPPQTILDKVLNNRSLRVTNKDADGKTFTDQEGTTKLNDVAQKMRQRFGAWVWTDATRALDLLTTYNRRYNNLAPRKFDGSHLQMPGVSLRLGLLAHQKRGIWRAIQTGNMYAAHAVGAGKTFMSIGAAMEQKRLGLIRKPMFAVPNHMLEQFAGEFKQMYPAANIMVADDENFTGDMRRRFVAAAAVNAPDAIIITHSAFGRVNLSPKAYESYVSDLIAEIEEALDSVKKDDRLTRSRLEKRKEALQQRIDSRFNADKGDKAVSFEDLGVDYLVVDEAHLYRKLDFFTNRSGKDLKGISPEGSAASMDLHMKVQHLEKQRPGRSHMFLSGTPVTNTLGEIYTLQRFFTPEQMEADGTNHFDAWANAFGEMNPGFERNAAGDYEVVTRFSKFVNVPELMMRVRQFMDVLTSSQLGDLVKRPDLPEGIQNVIVKPSAGLKSYMDNELRQRIARSRAWKPSKDQPNNPDPLIAIIGDARMSVIDDRFYSPGSPNNPQSKLNAMIDNIIADFKSDADQVFTTDGKKDATKGATQIVFSAVGLGAGARARGFDPRAWMTKRFTEAGISADQVLWAEDLDSDAKKAKAYAKMRDGSARILIGSPAKLGTGVNVQKRLKSLHYLSPPWFPSDVEQPHGRILRQGNQNPDVRIRWYATEGTYDSTQWDMVARKGRFIAQAMAGDTSVRNLEDISEVSSYEMASALSAGDQRVIQMAGLSADIERLTRLRAQHYSDQANVASELRFTRLSLASKNKSLTKLAPALEKHEPMWGASFQAKAGGQNFTKREQWGLAALKRIEQEVATWQSNTTVTIGEVGGLPVNLSTGLSQGMWSVVIQVTPDEAGNYGFYSTVAKSQLAAELLAMDPQALGTNLGRAYSELPSKKMQLEGEIRDTRDEIAKLERAQGRPFSEDRALAEKIAERAQIQEQLTAEGLLAQAAASAAVKSQDADKAARAAAELGDPGIGDPLNDPPIERESRRRIDSDDPLVQVFSELAQRADAFRYATSSSKQLGGALDDLVGPGVLTVERATERYDRTENELWKDVTDVFVIRPDSDPKSEAAVFLAKGGRVWLDISRWNVGERGGAVYQAVGDWAHNNGYTFEGDPMGLSAQAVIRRAVHLLSSALRWGTTSHLAPHERQMAVDPLLGNKVRPINWQPGQHGHNVRELLLSVAHAVNSAVPGFNRVEYDLSRGKFAVLGRDGNGGGNATRSAGGDAGRGLRGVDEKGAEVFLLDRQDLSDADFQALGRAIHAALPANPLQTAGAGSSQIHIAYPLGVSDLKVAALVASVVRRAGTPVGRAILDRVSAGLLQPLARTLHSRGTGTVPANITAAVDQFRAAFPGAATVDIRVVPDHTSLPGATAATEATIGMQGDRFVVTLVAASLNPQRAQQVLAHEIVGHYGLRALLGRDYDVVLESAAKQRAKSAPLRAAADAAVAEYQRTGQVPRASLNVSLNDPDYATPDAVRLLYPDYSESQLADEVMARMAEVNEKPMLLARIMMLIRKALRALGLDLDYGRAELMQFVQDAGRALREMRGVVPASASRGSTALWRSALADGIADLPDQAAPAAQWIGRIKNLKGVKPDEMEWSGVLDWLGLQQGKVTKGAVLDYLRGNGVRVEEVELTGGVQLKKPAGWRFEADPDFEDGGIALIDERGNVVSNGATEEEALRNARDDEAMGDMPYGGDVKYAAYQLPGGTNYREVLLTLPSKAKPLTSDEFGNVEPAAYNAAMSDGTFRSNHWDQPNVLAHIRLNDRTDADGKKVLFVEEVQSDWAQAGRRNGFGGESVKFEPRVRPGERAELIGRLRAAVTAKLINVGVERDVAERAGQSMAQSTMARMVDMEDEYIDLLDREYADRWAAVQVTPGIPRAPFVEKTDAWVALALKRILRMAADGGYDKVAFITGEQSAKRYQLSNQVNQIVVTPRTDTSRTVRLWLRQDSSILTLGVRTEDGIIAGVEGGPGGSLSQLQGKRLDEVIGKDMAEKIMKGPERQTIEGAGLEIGGTGMKAFYDKIVPKVLADVAKKVGGGKPTTVTLPAVARQATTGWENTGTAVDTPASTQPAIDITPAMRAALAGPQPLFSRAPLNRESRRTIMAGAMADSWPTVAQRAHDAVFDLVKGGRTFGLWGRTIGTQMGKARQVPAFGRVFDRAQKFVDDVAKYALRAEGLAPTILPKVGELKDVPNAIRQAIGKGGMSQADGEWLMKTLAEGTLAGDDPSPLKGVVFSPSDLMARGATETQIALYREARQAIDQSLEDTAVASMFSTMRAAGMPQSAIDEIEGAADSMQDVRDMLAQRIGDLIERARQEAEATWWTREQEMNDRMEEDLDTITMPMERMNARLDWLAKIDRARDAVFARVKALEGLDEKLEKIVEKVSDLREHGYAPLMRFGRFGLTAFTENGSVVYFSRFDSVTELQRRQRELVEENPQWQFEQNEMPTMDNEIFRGVDPHTMMLFAKSAGIEDAALQKWYELAVAERSALKRMIHRQGTPGYSLDAKRVLSAFITSNARFASNAVNNHVMKELAEGIRDGGVKDEALKLVQYVSNPIEEAAGLRGLMFTWYLGGSLAAGMVNLTQPVLMTFPYLARFGAGKAAKAVKDGMAAAAASMRGKPIGDVGLARAMNRAKEESITQPNEIHALMASSRGAFTNPLMQAFHTTWGANFALTEAFNRSTTFAAAYIAARNAGERDPYAFAKKTVYDTQGIYTKANRPNWARGAIGSVLFTFKQFSIAYMEFLHQLVKEGTLPKQQLAIALGMLVLVAGLEGLPGSDDLDDLIDTVGQWLGYGTNVRQSKRQILEQAFGKTFADLALRGISTQMGLDFSARLGLGDLIPGTGLLIPANPNKTRDAGQLLGPAGSLVTDAGKAMERFFRGDFGGGVQQFTPIAVRNALKGASMLVTGEARDDLGRAVTTASPIEAGIKMVGFNPQRIATEGRRMQEIRYDANIVNAKAIEIREAWARGVARDNMDEVRKAQEMLREWNEKNPDMRIRVRARDVLMRVRDIKQSRAQRFIRSVPASLRDEASAAIDEGEE